MQRVPTYNSEHGPHDRNLEELLKESLERARHLKELWAAVIDTQHHFWLLV